MPLAVYVKAPPKTKSTRPIVGKKTERFFFAALSLIGLFSIFFATWPILVWQLKTLPKLTQGVNLLPIPQNKVLSSKITLEESVQVVQDPDGFSYFTTDYKPPASTQGGQGPRPQEFFLTIPKLDIENAKAKVDSTRFDTNLSHFPGTALPGEIGNSFITGHSVLPQFADPQNYRAIFTKLADLEIGDDVYVQIAGQRLHFVVQYAKIISPHDTSVLLPISQSGRNLTLMTCVPPGTNTKRLVVITSLI
jgi:LPXTG-site transpeptidase (sortase) family protein